MNAASAVGSAPMIALDTNVIARHLLGDGTAAQRRAARQFLAGAGPYWVPVTVFVELTWLLEERRSRSEITEALTTFLRLPNVKAQHESIVIQAFDWYQQGLDFPDALHLALAGTATAELVTFDEPFARRAGALATTPPVRCLR